jgi:dihydropteroate synthase
MGILNTSPESFFKKSIKTTKDSITRTVIHMENNGADFIDVGGMSTAPYLKTTIPRTKEAERITKAIKIIQDISNIPISVDTPHALVAKTALDMGVEIINDVTGLKHDKDMPNIIAKYEPSLILCAYDNHTMYNKYTNLITQTSALLKDSIRIAKKANINPNKIVLDPSIGFFRRTGRGKFFTRINADWVYRDLLILQNLKSLKQNHPIMVSISNKSFIGRLTGKQNPSDRISDSLAFEIMSVLKGADIIRTHNVKETSKAVKTAENLR